MRRVKSQLGDEDLIPEIDFGANILTHALYVLDEMIGLP